MPRRSFGTPVLAKWLVNHLKQTTKINQDELLSALTVRASDSEDSLRRLSPSDYLALLNWAALRTGNVDFGLNLASQTANDSPGCLGNIISHTATLRDHFQLLHRFGVVLQEAMSFTFVEGPISSRMEYRLLSASEVNSRHDSEYTLALMVHFCRHYVRNHFVPTRVHFTHSKPYQITRHLPIFGQAVHFEQPVNAIYFPSFILDTGISDVNSTLLVSLRAQVSKNHAELMRQDTLINQVRFFIAVTLSSGACVVEKAAMYLSLSQRSLIRYLQNLGTSFRKLKQGVMMEMAKRALAESNASMGEISLHLGFSETSAFDRSFRKLTGDTPLQYRRLAQG